MDRQARGVDIRARGVVDGEVELRLPIREGRGAITTQVKVDAPVDYAAEAHDGAGRLAVDASLQAPISLELPLFENRARVDAALDARGRLQLALAVPDRIDRIGGQVALKGNATITLAHSGTDTLKVPVTVDGKAGLDTNAAGRCCLDADAALSAPLKLRLPLPDGRGEVDVDLTASGTADVCIAVPAGHGQIQAQGMAMGPVALALRLPDRRGRVSAQGSIRTPFTLAMVTPEGRAKLGAEGIVDAEVELAMALPGAAGWIEARAPVKGPATVHLLLPDGHGEVSAAAPIHTVLQLREIVIPGADRVLGLDVDLDGAVELRYALGGHSGQVRARVKAGMPLEPVLRLVRGEVERHVQVARMWLRQPRLDGPHDLALPLYVEARRGLRTQVEVTASLSINPATKTVELRSIRARGANALGEAASRLYLNRRVFRPLGHTVLFDPAAMLPSTVTIHALHFADATPATVGLVVDLTVGIEDRDVRIGVGST